MLESIADEYTCSTGFCAWNGASAVQVEKALEVAAPVEHGSVMLRAAATATAASAALPPCCKMRMPACSGHIAASGILSMLVQVGTHN